MDKTHVDAFASTCVNMSILSFWVFVVLVACDYITRLMKKPAMTTEGRSFTGSEIPPTIEALGKLADSFTKAGPALSALVASIAFMAFAAIPLTVQAVVGRPTTEVAKPQAPPVSVQKPGG